MLGSADSSPAVSQHGPAPDGMAADDVEGGGGISSTPDAYDSGGIDNVMLGFQNLSMSSVDPPKHIVANVSGFVVRGDDDERALQAYYATSCFAPPCPGRSRLMSNSCLTLYNRTAVVGCCREGCLYCCWSTTAALTRYV